MITLRARVALVVFAASVAMSGCGNQWNMLKARQAFKEANTMYAAKEYEQSVERYSTVLELDPDADPRVLVPVYFYRGSSYHLQYRPARFDDPVNDAYLEKAIEDYGIALVKAEEHGAEYEYLGSYKQYAMEQLAAIYRDNLDDLANAEKYFMGLIELDEGTPERYYALADVYERFHDPEDMPLMERAIEAYKKPVALTPEDPIVYRQVANLLNKYGRFTETMGWLAQARDVQANNPEGYYLIAVHYWDKVYRDPDLTNDDKMEFIGLGLAELERSLEINDEYVDALIYQNLLLREQAKIDPRNKVELTAKADEIRDRALELKRQQEEAAAAARAAEAAAVGDEEPSQ